MTQTGAAALVAVSASVGSVTAEETPPRPEELAERLAHTVEMALKPRPRPDRAMMDDAQETTSVAASIRLDHMSALGPVNMTLRPSRPSRISEADSADIDTGVSLNALLTAPSFERSVDASLKAHANAPRLMARQAPNAPSVTIAAVDAVDRSPESRDAPVDRPTAQLPNIQQSFAVDTPISPSEIRGELPAAPPIDRAHVATISLGVSPTLAAPPLESLAQSGVPRDPEAPATHFAEPTVTETLTSQATNGVPVAPQQRLAALDPRSEQASRAVSAPSDPTLIPASAAPAHADIPAGQTATRLLDRPPAAEPFATTPKAPAAPIEESVLAETDQLETIDAPTNLSIAPAYHPTAPEHAAGAATPSASPTVAETPSVEPAIEPMRIVVAGSAAEPADAATGVGDGVMAAVAPDDGESVGLAVPQPVVSAPATIGGVFSTPLKRNPQASVEETIEVVSQTDAATPKTTER